MKISGKHYGELTDLVVKATEPGKITEWAERIAQLAKELGLPISMMKWSLSPRNTAAEVVEYADAWDKIPELEEVLKKLEM